METSNLVLIIIAVIVGVFIFSKVAKFLFKLLGIAIIAILVYLFWTGGDVKGLVQPGIKSILKNKSITELHAKFCSPARASKAACACIIQPVYTDLNSRFSKKDLETLSSDKDWISREVMVSYESKKEFMNECLKSKKEDKLKVLEGMKDIYENVRSVGGEN